MFRQDRRPYYRHVRSIRENVSKIRTVQGNLIDTDRANELHTTILRKKYFLVDTFIPQQNYNDHNQ